MNTQSGFVALVGAPNAGKSTLLNQIIGQKISIVSRKAQTTRTTIRGIYTNNMSQIIFVDTPGMFRPKRRLDRSMVGAAWSSIHEADQIILLIDAHQGIRKSETRDIIQSMQQAEKKIDVAINKIDGFDRQKLLALADEIYKTGIVNDIYMISALNGSGVKDLISNIQKKLPERPFLYPDDDVTDISVKFLAAEITREKIYDRLHDEIPYNLTVETEVMEKSQSGTKTPLRLEQTIYVTHQTHKTILLGKQGQMIKLIGSLAREELSQILSRPVHLFLFVKVRENWQDDPERYQMMHLDIKADRVTKTETQS